MIVDEGRRVDRRVIVRRRYKNSQIKVKKF